MKKRFTEQDGEMVLEDAHMAAALQGPFWDDKGKEWQGLEFLRVQDTEFDDTKEIVFRKDEHTDEIVQLYLNRLIRVEPHTYANNLAELRDLIKSRIKETSSHNVHKKTIEEHDE